MVGCSQQAVVRCVDSHVCELQREGLRSLAELVHEVQCRTWLKQFGIKKFLEDRIAIHQELQPQYCQVLRLWEDVSRKT